MTGVLNINCFLKTIDQIVAFLEHIPKFSHEQTGILLNRILKHLHHHNMDYKTDIVRVLLFHTINSREITTKPLIYGVVKLNGNKYNF